MLKLGEKVMKITAIATPFSSVVGTGLVIKDETGAVIAYLPIRGFDLERKLDGREYAIEATKLVERVAAAINAGQFERQISHTKRGTTYDVVASAALFQVSDTTTGVREVVDGDPVTVYRNDHGTFVRFPDEVVSPRFEPVKP